MKPKAPKKNEKGEVCTWTSSSPDGLLLRVLIENGMIKGMGPKEVQNAYPQFGKYSYSTFNSSYQNTMKRINKETELLHKRGLTSTLTYSKNKSSKKLKALKKNEDGEICTWDRASPDALLLKFIIENGMTRGMGPTEMRNAYPQFAKYSYYTFNSARQRIIKNFRQNKESGRIDNTKRSYSDISSTLIIESQEDTNCNYNDNNNNGIILSNDKKQNISMTISTVTMHNSNIVNTVTIHVDPYILERTPYPFKCYPAQNLKGITTVNGIHPKHYNGYIITMKTDVRNVLGGGENETPDDEDNNDEYGIFNYRARVYSKNQILVDAPALDYSDAGNDDNLIREILGGRSDKDREDNQCVIDAFDAARNQFNYDVQRKHNTMQYLLQFPSNVHLSSEVLEINNQNSLESSSKNFNDKNLLKMEAFPLVVQCNKLNHVGPSATPNFQKQYWAGKLFWRVADLAQIPNQMDDKKKKSSDTSTKSAFMKYMGVSNK